MNLKIIDYVLDRLSMYRVVIYTLFIIIVYALILSIFGVIRYDSMSIIFSTAIILAASTTTHYLFKLYFGAPANYESALITALLLICIARPVSDLAGLLILAGISAVAIMSKYVLAYRYRHIFNPAALALVLFGMSGYAGSSWWIVGVYTMPLILLGSLLVVRKIRRVEMFLIYVVLSSIFTTGVAYSYGGTMVDGLLQTLFSWPIVFFAGYMLSEPLSTPPTRNLVRVYAVLGSILTSFSFRLGPVHSSPELALILINIYSYIYSAKERFVLILKEKILLARDTYEFVFIKSGNIKFLPGQYMEWTLPHINVDKRGVKRSFTIASSYNVTDNDYTESEVKLGVKFVPDNTGSSFKKRLLAMNSGEVIYAVHPTGDFLMPEDKTKRVVWIAGGIGITPYISMIRDLLDKNEKRDITLFYANKQSVDIAYIDLLDRAISTIGLRVIYILDDLDSSPSEKVCECGFIDESMLSRHITDITDRVYYISGPHMMVENYKSMLRKCGVRSSNIITDYFPGFM